MLKNWTRGGWKPGTWSVHRGPALPSRLPSSSIRSSRLGSTSILHLVQFLLRPSTVSAVAWFAFVWTIENCGCVKHCCRWARSCRPSLNAATQGRLCVTAPQINALHTCCWWFDDQSQISLDGIYISDHFRGNVPIGVGFELLQKVFFPEKMSHNWFLGAIILALNVDASWGSW